MSTFGTAFRVTTYGESHCASVGAIIDGCPPVCALRVLLYSLLHRHIGSRALSPGYSNSIESPQARSERPHYSSECAMYMHRFKADMRNDSQRNEKDMVHVQSGVEMGVTLGTPIGLLVKNEDQRPHDYTETDLYPRPSHADYTYLEKYGIKASSGGGRSSARETIGLEYLLQSVRIYLPSEMYRPRRCRCYRREISQNRLWHRDRSFRQLCWQGSSPIYFGPTFSHSYQRR